MNLGGILKVVQGWVKLKGNSDNTNIGNVVDQLKVRIFGDTGLSPDVETKAGKNRLLTDAIVTVEEVFGQDPLPDSYFRIDNTGAENDTIKIDVAATTADPSVPDRDVPAYTKTFTTLLAEVGDEIALRDRIVSELNTDSTFTDTCFLKANAVKDRSIVHISSRKLSMDGEFYERNGAGDFATTVTGTASTTDGFDNFVSRGKSTSLARDPDNPHRLGILGISGSVTTIPGAIGKRFDAFFKNGGSSDMLVDGSVTPVTFRIEADATDDLFFEQIRMFGGGNGIKFGKFLSQNVTLTIGIEVTIKSDNETLVLQLIKSTEDFKNLFSFPSGDAFRIDVQSGSDQFLAIFEPPVTFPIRKSGTFGAGNDDYVQIKIQDDISSGLSQLEGLGVGFKKES